MSHPMNHHVRNGCRRHVAKCKREVVVGEHCPDKPYLQLKLPLDVGPVRLARFRIVSHDQGFCDNPRSGYFSWCMVAVVNPSGRSRCGLQAILNNRIADRKYREQVKTWDADNTADQRVQHLLASIRPGDTIQMIPKARFTGWRNFVREAEIEIFTQDYRNSVANPSPTSPLMGVGPFGRQRSIYETLHEQQKEIRLLRLRPRSHGDHISCTIELASLRYNSCRQFEALSYCWGDPTEPRTIRVTRPDWNGRFETMRVTVNLYRALARLRPETGQDRVLWIDAICINQWDSGERAQQVGIMREIYSKASRVLVWLGPCAPYIQRQIDDACVILKDHQKAVDRNRVLPNTPKIHDYRKRKWGYFHQIFLFELDFFKRSWVLQEVFNARDVFVYCGKNGFPWSVVLRLNKCMVAALKSPGPPSRAIMPPAFSKLFHLRDSPGSNPALAYSKTEHKAKILDVFLDGLDLETSDPRDKLFALLSFGRETCKVSELPRVIAPDYGKSIGRVFADFTRWWIVTYRSLSILATIHASKGRSWQAITRVRAPPYENRASWSIWHDGRRSWAHASLGYFENPFGFHASDGLGVDLDLVKGGGADPMVLDLIGRKVATIQSVGPYPYYQGLLNEQNRPDFFKVYEWIFDPAKASGTWLMGASDHEAAREARGHHRTHFPADHIDTHSRYARKHLAVECHDRCYLRTEEGMTGLCPPGAQTGDIIAVLNGARTPFVLRSVRTNGERQHHDGSISKYYLIGECCLKHVMRGQAEQRRSGWPLHQPLTIFSLV